MIDIKRIIQDPETITEILRKRDPDISLDSIISLESERKRLQQQNDNLRHQINEATKYMSSLDKDSPEFIEERKRSKELGEHSGQIKIQLDDIIGKLETKILDLPNVILPGVPISQNKEDKEIVHQFKEPPKYNFAPLDHVRLGEKLEILDFKRATKIAESGFPLYRGKGAVLEWALINYMIDNAREKGFELFLPPLLANTKSLITTGNLPKFKEEIYSCERDDLHLIPTAETVLTNLYRDETIGKYKLPLRLAAYTPCFRREAGAAGKLTRGLMRLHQFNKLETYSICLPEQAESEHKLLIENAEQILKDLGLHFRLANLPSCDLAQQSSQTFDIEIWLPLLKQYSEVSSASNCLDYQSRRANIKFKSENSKGFVYTLNCSALATPRIMIALYESCQTKEGHIVVPEVLRAYTKFDEI